MKTIERVKLIPYCEIDGIRTFSDSYMKGLFQRMIRDNTVELVFMDGSVVNEDEFITEMRNSMAFITIIDDDYEKPGAIQWLNRPQHRWIQHHVNAFSEYWATDWVVPVAKQNLSKMIRMTDSTEQYMFDVFIGIVPQSNVPVLKLAEKIGMAKTGYIPNGIWNAYKQQSENAYLLTYTREGETNESI